jgi:hypothetical protein
MSSPDTAISDTPSRPISEATRSLLRYASNGAMGWSFAMAARSSIAGMR